MSVFSIIKRFQLEGARRLDAEYYQPEYLELQKRLFTSKTYKLWKDLAGKFITGPFGSEFNVENYDPDSKHRYVRGKDVKEFFLQDDDNVYIPEKDFERLKKYALQEGDILTSVVGTPGITAIVYKNIIPAIFSCKSTVFRSTSINPYYFIAYLNSNYGYKLLERSVRGALQTGLNIDDLKQLPVFIPAEKTQKEIAEIIRSSKQELENSKSLYSQAEQMLLEELGLRDFEADDALWAVVKLSEVKKSGRMDAEYFEPKFEKLIKAIKEHNPQKLGEIVILKKGIEPGSGAYVEEGKQFIRVSSISKEGIGDRDPKFLSDTMYKELKKDYEPKAGEILLTKDASPGVACVVREPVEGIISSGILRLKVKSEVEADYLVLCINSIIGQYHVARDAGGSIIKHWKPSEIKEVLIPVLPKTTQQKIAERVAQSHAARKRAKELLEEAKRTVERLIEEGGK